MLLYRISLCKRASDISGMGAKLFGGRWNSIGVPMLYLTSSRALAAQSPHSAVTVVVAISWAFATMGARIGTARNIRAASIAACLSSRMGSLQDVRGLALRARIPARPVRRGWFRYVDGWQARLAVAAPQRAQARLLRFRQNRLPALAWPRACGCHSA